MRDASLSLDQMEALLDNAPVAIYVSSADDMELLYANPMAKSLFLRKSDVSKLTCYQAAGYDEPCPFCHTAEMGWDKLWVREFHHPGNGRVYQLSGKLLNWGEQAAHIEYIVDITERKREEERSREIKESLQATFSNVPCGLCVYCFDGERISPVFHNPAFYEMKGYSDESIQQIEQQTNYLGVHPEDLEKLQEKIQRLIRKGRILQHTYRVWNDKKQEYRWIHLEGSVKLQQDGAKLIYGVYSDFNEQVRLEKELTDANEKMQDIVNAIPGGVAIYKVTDIFKTVYFSDGVPELTGYSPEEYRDLIKRDAVEMVYWEDAAMVVSKAQEVIQTHKVVKLEFRKQHRNGNIVWVRAQVKWIGEEDGCPLLHCVFHNISDLKEAQLEMDHLVNSIPGGIASYRVEGERFIPTYFSDGVVALSGHTREDYTKIFSDNALDMVYEPDRERVLKATLKALQNGEVLDVSYRMRHKDGNLIWIHLNGCRMGPLAETMKFYAVFTGMSAETRLFQSIANETADAIYVIGKENYDLLYANESKALFNQGQSCLGQKCYMALHGKNAPCSFCTLSEHAADGQEHQMLVDGTSRFYSTRFRETEWNGIPAYVKYVRDITEEVETRKEKDRLEQYFQSVLKNLPGGVVVVRCEAGGRMVPEFLSDGYIAMLGDAPENGENLYNHDILDNVCPDDRQEVREQMAEFIASGESHCEIVCRMQKKDGTFCWVQNTLSLIQSEEGELRVYAVYNDITKEREKQEYIRQQYNDLILQHYRTPGPDAVVLGHCNITKNRIIDIIDYTHSDLLDTFGSERESFFTGLSTLVVDPEERKRFLEMYLNKPALEAFMRGDLERRMRCFIRVPRESKGRYVQIKMNLVSTPDTGDVTGILTVTDITEQTITDRILYQLSVTGYDVVADVDLFKDSYAIVSCNEEASFLPPREGCYSQWISYVERERIVPRDKAQYHKKLAPDYMKKRLTERGPYTFAFSLADERDDIRTKNMTVSAIDLRLGRICLSRTDITESIREQQGLLRVIAYTFELAAFVDVGSRRLTLYTRESVLENLPPNIVENYDNHIMYFVDQYGAEDGREEARRQFNIQTILSLLEEKPDGYDFLFSYRGENGERYKQINVLWGDVNHKTLCLVRADVTDMLAAERQSKKALEDALAFAEDANQAKSDFLSAMSHDIRTPMNAIMGMTALAVAHIDDQNRVSDCLQKISISSKHLLSLINDVLDMSKIERSNIKLNRMKVCLPQMLDQLSDMMAPQARASGLQFRIRMKGIATEYFYGDSLRTNQIFINLLSNAIKFTPEGGSVDFLAQQIEPVENPLHVRYRFIVSDTGIGMTKEFLAHVFDPFCRSDNAARIEGTGLGLSITKGLVDLMRGNISVKSEIKKGTVFQVELEYEPASPEECSRAEKSRAESAGPAGEMLFAGRRFLVAEDNAINAEILSELLRMYGGESVVTVDGAQAVKVFQTAAPGTYDGILMDIQMPRMNGYEATRAIRELDRPDAGTIPIVAMTANAFAEDIQASLEAGMDAHIAKPLDVEMLKNTLNRVLAGKSK